MYFDSDCAEVGGRRRKRAWRRRLQPEEHGRAGGDRFVTAYGRLVGGEAQGPQPTPPVPRCCPDRGDDVGWPVGNADPSDLHISCAEPPESSPMLPASE